MTGKVLVIFAKAPVRGQVKSRLAADLGDDRALQAHVELTENTLSRLSQVTGTSCQLWLSQDHEAGVRWATQFTLTLKLQRDGDLGQRMCRAFAELFDQGADGVVLVGSDLPLVDASYIRQAQQRLHEVPVVLGPTEDGGYGLIGLTAQGFETAQAVFRDISWGTSAVLAQTRQRLKRADCDWQELATIWDVDNANDWQRYRSWKGATKG